ncbi:Cytochrome C oxidase, cbb3-type, subunit III [Neorhodopirellula lusitana]|uniref:Cytochrome C oxidase, cbb3-type, subunit III n=1 Tax=Neorhodopirellula lusitana TaxID=445327 RepID=A0ABY1QJQ0_9BACT|nr:quinol:electron acceptor oxidoreductase subunit ActD [Neorhodopirellula lusitana]SMP70304.1 Cytochrome C oxidase, cbb3-type, subunit III [Neorhodopirellula lusitana]
MTDKPSPAPETIADGKAVHGVVAEFTDVDSLLAACRRVRDAGYTKADAFTPFPVHGIDSALGIKPTVLPWIALAAGLTGTCIALTMQIWMNGIDYPYIISGKPFISLPAFIPVTFELTILLASFGTFFGMWALNGLPRFSNPMFTSPRFDRATDDTFFLFLDAKDSRFDEAGAKNLLADLGGEFIEPVVEDNSSKVIPKGLLIALATVIALSMIPALIVGRMRVTKSSSPRFHIFPDMDFSPAKDAQVISTLFADGRANRSDVPGTVARGALDWDLDFHTGIDMEKLASIDAPRAERLVAMMQSDQPTGSDEPAAAEEKPATEETATEETADEKPAVEEVDGEEAEAAEPEAKDEQSKKEEPKQEAKPKAETAAPEKLESATAEPTEPATDKTPWLSENPLELTSAVLERGQQQFGIYCSVCHGMNGTGNGLVNRRAQQILATTWTPPSNLHESTLFEDAYPDGKLFSTITNGIRKMPGYASQIQAKDRWAVVAYVRALQASRNGSLEDVPASQREKLKKQQIDVKAKLKKIAEAEAADAEKASS